MNETMGMMGEGEFVGSTMARERERERERCEEREKLIFKIKY